MSFSIKDNLNFSLGFKNKQVFIPAQSQHDTQNVSSGFRESQIMEILLLAEYFGSSKKLITM